jgi:hypothetical protein
MRKVRVATQRLKKLKKALVSAGGSAETVLSLLQCARHDAGCVVWFCSGGAFIWAIEQKILPALDWLQRNYSLGGSEDRDHALTQAACGWAPLLDWLERHGYAAPETCARLELFRIAATRRYVPALEWLRARGLASREEYVRQDIAEYFPGMPPEEVFPWLVSHGLLLPEDFDITDAAAAAAEGNVVALDWLARQGGAGSAEWFAPVAYIGLTRVNTARKFMNWMLSKTDVAEVIRKMPLLAAAKLVNRMHGPDLETLCASPAAGSRLLRAVAARGSISWHARANNWGQIVSRENCLAEGGAALRVLARPGRGKRQQLLALARHCRLTSSDFAAVGLRWPEAI